MTRRPLTVLITQAQLRSYTGTELYVRDLALELMRRGHRSVVYAPQPGELAKELRQKTIPTVSQISEVGVSPDIIHGHHNWPLLTALLYFPDTRAVSLTHDWQASVDFPLRHPRIHRYVAVDEVCRDRLVVEGGVSEEKVEVVTNFVDLARFRPRGPLPERPRRILVFSNEAGPGTFSDIIRAFGRKKGLTVDIWGIGEGAVNTAPEQGLGQYDVVIAKGKAAMEAMAVGCSVVLCDEQGFGGIITPGNFARFRRLNFGRRALSEETTEEGVAKAIAAYDPKGAAEVQRRLREKNSLGLVTDRLLEIYQEVLDEAPASDEDSSAVADFLEGWAVSRAQETELWLQRRQREFRLDWSVTVGSSLTSPFRRILRKLGFKR